LIRFSIWPRWESTSITLKVMHDIIQAVWDGSIITSGSSPLANNGTVCRW
jgi:hypothetical protein